MRVSCLAILVAVAVSGMAMPAAAAECVAPGGNPAVDWPAANEVPAARLYFRSDNAKAEHYVEMQRSGKLFSAVLPKVGEGTKKVAWRVATRNGEDEFVTRSKGEVAVSAKCAARLKAEQRKRAAELVVGETTEAPAVPAGFRCDGIIARVDSKGYLRAFHACNEQIAAGPAVADRNTAAAKEGAENKPETVKAEGDDKESKLTAESEGVGVGAPEHHRRPRRAPVPATPPRPRVVEPVSPARP